MRADKPLSSPRPARPARAGRTLVAVLTTASVGALLAAGGMSFSTACVTNGDVDAGLLPDGAPSSPNSDGSNPAPTFACIFNELDTYSCPDVTLASGVWTPKCVDEDNCSTRVSGTSTSAGCTQTTTYQDVEEITTSCAAWKQGGGTLPTLDSGAAAVCAPGSVASFKPTWHPPRAKTTACTKAQIDSYLQCLNDAASSLDPASCASWGSAISTTDQSCLTCLSSNESDATYGPLVSLPTQLIINVPGCIALAEGKTDGSGCGGALQADDQCAQAACLATCPTNSTTQLAAETACEEAANAFPSEAGAGGACATYANAAVCAGEIEAGDAGAAEQAECFGAAGGGTNAIFEAVSLAFCGP